MRLHITYEENPRNSYETVLQVVKHNKLEPKHGETMPELLSEFITLLGKEKEEWGGVKAMTETPLVTTSPRRNVIVIQGDEGSMTSKAVIEGVVDSPANRETRKEPDRPSSSKAVKQDLPKASNTLKEPDRPSSSKAVKQDLPKASNTLKEPDRPSSGKAVKQDLPKASNTLKEPDRPSSSKSVKQDLPKASNTLKGTDDPSTNIAIIPATNKKTLKVKIYMGTGWDTDFPKLHRGSSPDLFVNAINSLMIHGGKIQKTVHKRSWTPSWGGEFVFPLSSLENDELVVEVYDHTLIFKDKFAGTFRLWVSKLKPGIQVIPLSDEVGKQCRTARLLMRFMFV
ncbi:unnamed protein product [Brassica oleracea var. botrytis]|uniref:(rape) hypothetical protein n=1 Tax=Brassica napus TaxID=3708 RepID=A0A816Q4Y9_BRANA|nr:unnamed protein product [Brassica napus]